MVATGSINGPWGTTLGAKLTVASPTPIIYQWSPPYDPTKSWYQPISETPNGEVGFMTLDLQLTKEFTVFDDQVAYVRLDALNVLNEFNPDPYNSGYSLDYGDYSKPSPSKPVENRSGNSLGVPATFKLSVGYRF